LPEHRIGIKVTHLCETRVFTPEQILAILLTKLKDVTESYLKTKISDCVLTVPCYWTDTQRRSVLDASKIVELNCLRIVNETTAVALNYGIYKQDLPEESEKARRVCFSIWDTRILKFLFAHLTKGN
jgi:molecular chaperone DnaK (HSP70)